MTERMHEYVIEKYRCGGKSSWESWRYEAKDKETGDYVGKSRAYATLDSLAEDLAGLPDVHLAEFFPGNHNGRARVSLCDTSLTQYGTVTDDELAQLGSLVQFHSLQGR